MSSTIKISLTVFLSTDKPKEEKHWTEFCAITFRHCIGFGSTARSLNWRQAILMSCTFIDSFANAQPMFDSRMIKLNEAKRKKQRMLRIQQCWKLEFKTKLEGKKEGKL